MLCILFEEFSKEESSTFVEQPLNNISAHTHDMDTDTDTHGLILEKLSLNLSESEIFRIQWEVLRKITSNHKCSQEDNSKCVTHKSIRFQNNTRVNLLH